MVSLCSIRRPPTKVQIQSERVCGPRRSARVVHRRSALPTRRSNVCCSVIGHSRAAGSAAPRLQDGAAANSGFRDLTVPRYGHSAGSRNRITSRASELTDRLCQSKPNAAIHTHRLASKATRDVARRLWLRRLGHGIPEAAAIERQESHRPDPPAFLVFSIWFSENDITRRESACRSLRIGPRIHRGASHSSASRLQSRGARCRE